MRTIDAIIEVLSVMAFIAIITCGGVYIHSQVSKKNILCDGPVVQVGESLYRQCIVEQ